jgi:hypothetical protein
MIGNPRGYGKSALIMELAYKRDEICKRNEIPSGPVLFTDFGGVKNASEAEERVLETIRPLFFTHLSFIFKNNQKGSALQLCLCFSTDMYFFLQRNYRIN